MQDKDEKNIEGYAFANRVNQHSFCYSPLIYRFLPNLMVSWDKAKYVFLALNFSTTSTK